MTFAKTRRVAAVLAAVTAVAGLSACYAGAGGLGGNERTIRVLMVNNPQMVDLQKLTAEHFSKQTGITVDFTVLPENDLRDKASQEFSSQARQYDVATLSNFEIPFYSKNDWLVPLTDLANNDKTFDQADILKPMSESLTGPDGELYGQPFYGESSFLMYRKDVFDAKGLTVPEKPTWRQVADLAAKVDKAQPGMRGICLRGLPGWGEVWAPLTTVVNTFGGTWFDQSWNARTTSPEFKQAVNFYVDLVRKHGQPGASQSGFTECLNNFEQGKVAMWYDATSAAGTLEGPGSPVARKVGYAQAPVEKTKSSGWLYAWSWAIEQASENQDDAWTFVSWASSKEYEALVGEELGWARVPAGKRTSTYANPEYVKSAKAFAQPTLEAIRSADPVNPGVQPRPTVGIQFVDIPEFTDFGTKSSQAISSAIAGRLSVDSALQQSQELAQEVGDKYKDN